MGEQRTNRLVVLNGEPKGLEIVRAGLNPVGPGEVLMRVEMAGVCGTDVHWWTGNTEYPAPMVLGHEGVGIVEELGEGVTTDFASQPVAVGDRIVWAPELACHRCYSCTIRGDTSLCENPKALVCAPGDSNWAAYADYVLLPRDMAFFRAAKTTPPEALVAFGCALPTVVQAFERAGGLKSGESVVVQGSGPVGLAATLLARTMGAGEIVVLGRPAHRLDAARKLGADHVIDIGDVADVASRHQIVLEATHGRGGDLVVEATGVLAAVPEGLDLLANGGRYLVIGLWGTSGSVSIEPRMLNNKNQTLIGSALCQGRHFFDAVRLVERLHATTPLAEMVTHRFPLERSASALEASHLEQTVKAVVGPEL